jgi:hypothetical protein
MATTCSLTAAAAARKRRRTALAANANQHLDGDHAVEFTSGRTTTPIPPLPRISRIS